MKKIIILAAAIGQILALSTVDATPAKKSIKSMTTQKKCKLQRLVLPLLENGAKAGSCIVSVMQNPAGAAGIIGGDIADLLVGKFIANSNPLYAKSTRVSKALRAVCRVGGAFAGAFVATRKVASAAVITSAYVGSMAVRYGDNVLQRLSVQYRNIRNHTVLGLVSNVALYYAQLRVTNYFANGMQNLIMNQTHPAVQATPPADRAPQCPAPNSTADHVCPTNATSQPGSFPAEIPTVPLGEAADVNLNAAPVCLTNATSQSGLFPALGEAADVADAAVIAPQYPVLNFNANPTSVPLINKTHTAGQAHVPAVRVPSGSNMTSVHQTPPADVNLTAAPVCLTNAPFARDSNMTSVHQTPPAVLNLNADPTSVQLMNKTPAVQAIVPADADVDDGAVNAEGGQRGVLGRFMYNAVDAAATAIGRGGAAFLMIRFIVS